MPGKANFDIRNVPFRLMSICKSHSSSLQSSAECGIKDAGIVEQNIKLAEGA